MKPTDSVSVFGFKIYAGGKEYFANGATGVINTLNPHSYVLSKQDPDFRQALLSADILLPDGVGIKLAARILEGRRIEKFAGFDLHFVLLKALQNKHGSCFYFGSSEDTLSGIEVRIASEYPSIRTGYLSPPFRGEFEVEENDEMIEIINRFAPDVLFVGMTAPKQEKWVYEHRGKLRVPLICSIGAAFDFYAGTVKRPKPIWIRLGLEWLPRLLREPRRLWRRNFISTPLFMWYVGKEKLRRVFKVPEL